MKKLFSFEVTQKAREFLACRQVEDLGRLGFDVNQVIFNALHPRYYTFEMRKRSGGMRTIEAPVDPLKAIQRQFNFTCSAFIIPFRVRLLMAISSG